MDILNICLAVIKNGWVVVLLVIKAKNMIEEFRGKADELGVSYGQLLELTLKAFNEKHQSPESQEQAIEMEASEFVADCRKLEQKYREVLKSRQTTCSDLTAEKEALTQEVKDLRAQVIDTQKHTAEAIKAAQVEADEQVNAAQAQIELLKVDNATLTDLADKEAQRASIVQRVYDKIDSMNQQLQAQVEELKAAVAVAALDRDKAMESACQTAQEAAESAKVA